MAELVAVIGTAGAVANIIEVLGKSVKTMHAIRSEWKEADLTFPCFDAQFNALEAALTKVQEWSNTDLSDPYHELVMALDSIMTCCRLLIADFNSRLSQLHHKADEKLDFPSKLRLVFGKRGMEDLQKKISRVTGALNLLLTTCIW
jgi:guanine nucleotide-binding protein G(i) subunit alpha